MAKVVSVGISKEKGTRKDAVASGDLKESYGLIGDAHADSGSHRQVSLLAQESIEKMRRQGYQVGPGDFAENIASTGVDWKTLPLGTRVKLGDTALVEITQIGKECIRKCAIYYQTGDCIMPREGVFARVLEGGEIRCGDPIEIMSGGESGG